MAYDLCSYVLCEISVKRSGMHDDSTQYRGVNRSTKSRTFSEKLFNNKNQKIKKIMEKSLVRISLSDTPRVVQSWKKLWDNLQIHNKNIPPPSLLKSMLETHFWAVFIIENGGRDFQGSQQFLSMIVDNIYLYFSCAPYIFSL